jgi:hypothetical protein
VELTKPIADDRTARVAELRALVPKARRKYECLELAVDFYLDLTPRPIEKPVSVPHADPDAEGAAAA